MATPELANATPMLSSTDLPENLKPQDPQQALGLESQGSLVKSVGIALVLTVLMVGAFTAGPYVLGKAFAKTSAGKQPDDNGKQQAKKQQPPKKQPKNTNNPPAVPPTQTTKNDKTGQPKVDKGTLDKLGIGETKTGAPSIDNPLNNKTGTDILDELDK